MRKFLTGAMLAAAMLVAVSGLRADRAGDGQNSRKSVEIMPDVPFWMPDDQGRSPVAMYKVPIASAAEPGRHANYKTKHGTKFSQGYYYKGRHHTHWTRQGYQSKYGCWCYYCPSATCWYYWCEPRYCYLPVTSMEYANQGDASDLPPERPAAPRRLKKPVPIGLMKP